MRACMRVCMCAHVCASHYITIQNIDTDLLAYDIDQEVSPHKATNTIFVRTDSNQSDFALLQPNEKVKKTWYNHLQKLENKVDPLYAFDQPCYTYQESIVS